jgi:hypothetical protein
VHGRLRLLYGAEAAERAHMLVNVALLRGAARAAELRHDGL